MKKFILLLTVFCLGMVAKAQTAQDVAGVYKRVLVNNDSDTIIYTLDLNADGTFQFHSYSKIDLGPPGANRFSERNSYGQGTWSLDKKVVFFDASSSDFDDKLTLDFGASKARFISKHPRDKSDKVVETALQFYESDISWMASVKILKIN